MNDLNLSYWLYSLILFFMISCNFNQKASSPLDDFYSSFGKQIEKEVLFTFEQTKYRVTKVYLNLIFCKFT